LAGHGAGPIPCERPDKRPPTPPSPTPPHPLSPCPTLTRPPPPVPLPPARHWRTLLARPAVGPAQFEYAQVPFDHPLWTLFSSGTTGLPKPIVHGHGGILLETLKNATFHFDLHPREPVFYFTTTGWMLWNFLVSTPLTG